jgi:cell cycle protein kinase DBF2
MAGVPSQRASRSSLVFFHDEIGTGRVTDEGVSLEKRLLAHKDKRLSTLDQVKKHAFFEGVPWSHLRQSPTPFVPALDSEIEYAVCKPHYRRMVLVLTVRGTSTGYFDDFGNEADMAKYAEVRAKQKDIESVRDREQRFGRGVWVGRCGLW